MTLIQYECADNVATITLTDPKTLNAASIQMVEELMRALRKAEAEARVIILTGNGRGFCSGANLSDGDVSPGSQGYDAGRLLETHFNPLMLLVRALNVPTIAAVNGVAAGLGFPLALACDHILAAESAYFFQAFRHIGLVPDGGSAYFLVQCVGRVRASAMMMLGERVSAQQALSFGLINAVCTDSDLLPSARAVALTFATGPTRALSLIKRLAWAGGNASFEDILAMERQFQFESGQTADHREGIAAFLEKRKPNFQGV